MKITHCLASLHGKYQSLAGAYFPDYSSAE